MTLLLFIAPALTAALLAYLLTPLASRLAVRVGAIDQPGPRKIHSIPTPRLGGVAVIAAVAVVLFVAANSSTVARSLPQPLLLAILAGVLPIFAISVLDDIRPQKAGLKFGLHLMGATTAVALGIRLNEVVHLLGHEVRIGWLAIPISILWLAGITNAFNIVDGLDGLSAGLALISAVSLAGVSLVTHRYGIAATAAVLAGALTGFLPRNFYPAKIYLGDSGATAIGFFLACLTLGSGSTTSAGLAVTLPLLVVGVPLADTLLAMSRRLVGRLAGARAGIFDADRNHIHHRLMDLGLGHKRAVLSLYGVGILLALSAFASLFMKEQDASIVLLTLFVAAVVGVAKLGYDEFAVVRNGAVLRFYDKPVLQKGLFVVFADLAMVVAALYASIGLKYDDWALTDTRVLAMSLLALMPAVTLAIFASLRMYRRSWAQANVDDILRATLAVTMSSIAGFLVARFTAPVPIPATFFVTYTLVMLLAVNGGRASYKVLFHWNRRSSRDGEAVVIYGAGNGGTLALREILTNSDVPMHPVGFIDDDPTKRGRFVHGYPVLGNLEALERLVLEGKAMGVVIASDKISMAHLLSAKKICRDNKVWMRAFKVNFLDVSTATRRTGPNRPRHVAAMAVSRVG